MHSNELKLAVECCSCAFADAPQKDLRDRASQVDWNLFVEVVRRHRVQGFAWDTLCHQELEIPAAPAEALAADARATAERNLRATVESKALLDSFRAADLPLLFFKGLTIAALVYRKPLLKVSWDLDVLIAPEDVAKAAAVLDEAGFQPAIPAVASGSPELLHWHDERKESVWYKPQSDLFLELHTRVTANPALLPGFTARSPSQDVEVAPGTKLPTFAINDLLLYSAVHGSSSAWFRLKWAADFAALLTRNDAPKPEDVYDRSRKMRVEPAVGQALLVADDLFGIGLDDVLRTELLHSPINRLLAAAAMRQLTDLREPGARRFGTIVNHIEQLFLMTGWHFKWREILRQLSDARTNRLVTDAGTASARLRAMASASNRVPAGPD